MRKPINWIIGLSLIAGLFSYSEAQAACSGSSPTWSSTIDQASIASCLSQSSAGDTINVSAGTASWSGGISLNGRKLVGAGSSTSGSVVTAGLVTMTKHASQYTKLNGFRFTGSDQHVVVNGDASQKVFIIGDNYFNNSGGAFMHIGANGGLVYSNSFVASPGHNADTFVVKPNESWASALTMGNTDTTGENNVYFEDNLWSGFLEISWDCDDGGRIVARHNTFRDSSVTAHGGGTGTSGNDSSLYGCRFMEIYDNVFDRVDNNLAINKWIWMRGGTGVIANNQMDRADSPDGSTYPNKNEILLTVGCPSSYPIGYQVGQSATPADATPDRPLLIFGNTAGNTSNGPGDSNFIAFGDNPGGACGSPSSYIQSGRDYMPSNTWGWTAYAYPHPLRTSGSGNTTPPAAPANLRVN